MLNRNVSPDQSQLRSTAQFAFSDKDVHLIDHNCALIRQREEWRIEVQLIAGDLVKDKRQDIPMRPLVVHLLLWPGGWCRYTMISIDGTSCRGRIVVPDSRSESIIHLPHVSQIRRQYSAREERMLRRFAAQLRELAWSRVTSAS